MGTVDRKELKKGCSSGPRSAAQVAGDAEPPSRSDPVAREVSQLLPLLDRLLTERTLGSRRKLPAGRSRLLAEVELHLSRRLGQILRETVRRGRPGAGSGERGGRLPPGISKDRSSKLQRLADIDRDAFVHYLESCEEEQKPASVQGALRFARSGAVELRRARTDLRRRRSAAIVLRPDMVDAIDRFMNVDLLVGEAVPGIEVTRHVAANERCFTQFGGNVLVSTCADPEATLPRIAELWRSAVMLQCIVVVAADTGATWFHRLPGDDWLCCFPVDSAACLLYQGRRRHGFWTAHQSIGAVLGRPASA